MAVVMARPNLPFSRDLSRRECEYVRGKRTMHDVIVIVSVPASLLLFNSVFKIKKRSKKDPHGTAAYGRQTPSLYRHDV
jgi:hypothetical protein